jgi:hypothetical protein
MRFAQEGMAKCHCGMASDYGEEGCPASTVALAQLLRVILLVQRHAWCQLSTLMVSWLSSHQPMRY